MKLEELKATGEAPEWMQQEGFQTISRGYLLPNETPRGMYLRVAKAAASYYADSSYWELPFFNAMWKNWLCPASPILSNMGTDRGLPISCNSLHLGDSVNSIFNKSHELAMLSKHGAGVGIYMGDVRGRGAPIKGNGTSEGVVPWCRVMDTTIQAVNQGSTRRGAAAVYLPIEHLDIEEFINIRRPTGDLNRRCLNLNHGICISDDWMNSMIAGDSKKRHLWQEILSARVTTGEPYLFFKDTVNSASPECYKENSLNVSTSNICCLSGDSLVLTRTGAKRIDSLVGMTVELWDGESWVENDTVSQRGEDELLRVHIKDGSTIDCNINHRWFAASSYSEIARGKYTETLAKDLKIGQWLESHSQEVHGSETTKGAYLKGFLMGDGTSTKDRPLLSLHSVKYMCKDALLQSANELPVESNRTTTVTSPGFGKEKDYTGAKGTYGKQIYVPMQGLGARRNELFPWVTSYRSGLPEEVYSWDKATKLKFLAGLFDADGTIGKHWSLQFSNKNKQLVLSVQRLLKTFGYSGNVEEKISTATGTARLTISSADTYELMKEMPTQRLHCECPPPDRKGSGWRKIIKIEKLEGKHPVYCPTLPTTGKFALANGLMTGNTEITLYTDADHTFVCCLSSLNLVRMDEWIDSDLPQVATRFLDAVMEEYITKTEGIPGLECSRRSAIKGRALGIGVLGWHTLLQQKGLPFDSFGAMQLNAKIFKTIRDKAELETAELAKELGEPEWCKGFNRRNTHLVAVAPTVSNSLISGGHSAGIEPIAANIFTSKTAKGTFITKNKTLEALLAAINKDTPEVWKSINEQSGSVQHLSFLSKEQKEVFLTAREINQHALVKQAIQRGRWIDQGQSLNLFFASNSDPKYIHQVHMAAWEGGLKTLYYLRAEGVLKGDLASRSPDECAACQG